MFIIAEGSSSYSLFSDCMYLYQWTCIMLLNCEEYTVCMCSSRCCLEMVRVSWDLWTLWQGVQWACAYPRTVLGWPKCFRILGSLDTLTRGAVGMCSSTYCLGMAKVFQDLGISWERKVVWAVSLIILAPSRMVRASQDLSIQKGMVWVAYVLVPVLSWNGESILGFVF